MAHGTWHTALYRKATKLFRKGWEKRKGGGNWRSHVSERARSGKARQELPDYSAFARRLSADLLAELELPAYRGDARQSKLGKQVTCGLQITTLEDMVVSVIDIRVAAFPVFRKGDIKGNCMMKVCGGKAGSNHS